MGVDGFRRLYLSEHEIWQVLLYYRDPNDSERVCWRTFADDVDQGIIPYEVFPEVSRSEILLKYRQYLR